MEAAGVLDRITDDEMATIIVEDIGEEFVIDVRDLPEGSKEGTWFQVNIKNHVIDDIRIDHEKTEQQSNRIKAKKERLKKKSGGSKFKRK